MINKKSYTKKANILTIKPFICLLVNTKYLSARYDNIQAIIRKEVLYQNIIYAIARKKTYWVWQCLARRQLTDIDH